MSQYSFNPVDFGLTEDTQLGTTKLCDKYTDEATAKAAFPTIPTFNVKQKTWEDWTVNDAAIMEAYERAEQAITRPALQLANPTTLYIPPGTYDVTPGLIWFYGGVEIQARRVNFAGTNLANAGTSPTWESGYYGFDTKEALAVVTIGYDSILRRPTKSTSRGLTHWLPTIINKNYWPWRPLHEAQGTAYRFLGSYDNEYHGISYSGPLKYGIILCDRTHGSIGSKFYLGQCLNARVAIKWRNLKWMNTQYFYGGWFEIHKSLLWLPPNDDPHSTHEGHDQINCPTTLIDYCNTSENPNDPPEEYPMESRFEPGSNHVEFKDTFFENTQYLQFWRAHNPRAWKFYGTRFEAFGIPVPGEGGCIYPREAIKITGDSACQNVFDDCVKNWDIMEFPEKYIANGDIEIRGKGMPDGYNKCGQGSATQQQFHDLAIERKAGSIAMYDEKGTSRFMIYPKLTQYKRPDGTKVKFATNRIKQVPHAEMRWCKANDNTSFTQEVLKVQPNEPIDLLLRISTASNPRLWYQVDIYGFRADQNGRSVHRTKYQFLRDDFIPYPEYKPEETEYLNLRLDPNKLLEIAKEGVWAVSLHLVDHNAEYGDQDHGFTTKYQSKILVLEEENDDTIEEPGQPGQPGQPGPPVEAVQVNDEKKVGDKFKGKKD